MRKFDMVTAKGYMHDLAVDSAWLTDYAQGKAEGQRLIDMTVTMNRARWLIAELLTEVIAEQTEPIKDKWGNIFDTMEDIDTDSTDCSWK